MKKLFQPKILLPTIVSLMLIGMVLYILFAPTTWWKPIYISFDTSDVLGETSIAQAAGPEATSGAPALPTSGDPAHTTEQAHSPAGSTSQMVMPAIQPGQGVMYKLEPKVVNLAEPGGLRYLQAGIVLEFHPSVKEYYEARVSGEASSGDGHSAGEEAVIDPFQEAIDALRPIIDDKVTTILSSKTYNDIATIEGKQDLKQELMIDINAVLGYQGIINIYFTEFVIQ